MAIHTIRNDTGAQLELWDFGEQLVNLANGQAIHTVPITITSVTITRVARGGVSYHNRAGAFVNGDSYRATLNGASVIFTGNGNVVTYT